jgi:uncharacterized protein (DUF1501 family)
MNQPSSILSRRRFLGLTGGLAAATAGGVHRFGLLGSSSSGHAGGPLDLGEVRLARRQVSPSERILVSVRLDGGLDFLNTVVPLNSGRYRDLRADGAIDEANVDALDSQFGLFAMPYLASRWSAGDLAIVHGVGWENSTLSHFEATDIWEKGSYDATIRTGWLGRTLGALGGSAADPLVGISVDTLSPSMYADGWWPGSIPADGSMPWLENPEWESSLRAGIQQLAYTNRNDDRLTAMVRQGHQMVFDLADTVGPTLANRDIDVWEGAPPVEISSGSARYFDGENEVGSGYVGSQLRTVADLIRSGVGTRAFHVEQGGYDTHGDQASEHPTLVLQLDHAIREFYELLGPDADRVTLMTWSEFGRRPEWNGSGTDHGTAGVQFVVGAGVRGGHHGEAPSLDRFDRDDNFVPTTDWMAYLGGVVGGVFDIDPRIVIPDTRRALEVIA